MGTFVRPKTAVGRTAAACAVIAVALGAAVSNLSAKDEEDDDLVRFEKEHPLGEVPGEGALLYVLRPTSAAFAIKSWFFRDQEVLGVNKGSSYFFVTLAPGKHVLWSKSENVDALELEAQSGKTYYVQQHVRIGGLKARTNIELLDDAEGAERLAKCDKHGTLTDSGLARGKELAAEHWEDAQRSLAKQAEKQEKKEAKAEKP
jgi:hypothetical protein